MIRKICCILVFFYCLPLHAGNEKEIDSIRAVLSSRVHDTVKVRSWAALSDLYEDSLPYASIECLEKGYALIEKDSTGLLLEDISNQLGHHLFYVGDYEKASRYFLVCLRSCKTRKNVRGLANCLNNLGSIYIELQDYEKALQSYKEALSIYNENLNKGCDTNEIAMATGNIGRCHYYMSNFGLAKEYYTESLLLSKKTGNQNRISLMYNNLGSIYAEQFRYDSALSYFNQAYLIQQQLDNKPMLITVINNIGEVYLKTKDYTNSINFYNKGLKAAKEVAFLDGEQVSYSGLHECYLEMKDYEQAHKYLELYTEIKDSIFNEGNTEKINEMLTRFDSEKKEQQIQLLQKDQEIRKFWQNALIIGVILLLLLAFLLYSRNRATQKAKKIIEQQKELIEEKQKEIVDSIHYAKRIQQTLLTNHEFINEHLPQNFIFFHPKDIVSGDFYWATCRDELFYLAVCDSTGHGVPGAFMSLLNIGFLSEAINEKNILQPNEVLNYVRMRLMNSVSKEGQQDGFDGLLLCFDKKSGKVSYAAANCSPLKVSGGQFGELPYDRMPVGKGESASNFCLYEAQLNKGDSLYLYTDGYADQFGGDKGKKFKYKQLNELLCNLSGQSMDRQSELLSEAFRSWKGQLEQVDDVCIIGIRL